MEDSERPRLDLAQQILPPGLLAALQFILERAGPQTMLVGGTALAGFYAGHRRSDDLDLFCASPPAFDATSRAVRLLGERGAVLRDPFSSSTFNHTVAEFNSHTFTIDVALDPNIFVVGTRLEAGPSLGVASLDTLLKMKSAALVSRCSEKDLYDLLWLFARKPAITLAEFIEAGREVDGGVNAESMLFSLGSTKLSEQSCGFVIPGVESADAAFRRITEFQATLVRRLSELLHAAKPTTSLGEVVALLRKIDSA